MMGAVGLKMRSLIQPNRIAKHLSTRIYENRTDSSFTPRLSKAPLVNDYFSLSTKPCSGLIGCFVKTSKFVSANQVIISSRLSSSS